MSGGLVRRQIRTQRHSTESYRVCRARHVGLSPSMVTKEAAAGHVRRSCGGWRRLHWPLVHTASHTLPHLRSQQSAASRQQRRFKTVCARAMARVRWRWGTYFGGRVAGPRGCSVRVDHISVAQAVVAGSPATLHASVSASHAAPRLPPWSSTRRRQAPAGVAWGRC